MSANKSENIWKSFFGGLFFWSSFLGVALGLIYFLRSSSNKPEFYWNLILLSFIVGTLVLSIRPEVLDKEWREPYPRLGFIMILSGIFILIGNGIFLFSTVGGNCFVIIGIIMLSVGLSSLLTVLGSHIIKI